VILIVAWILAPVLTALWRGVNRGERYVTVMCMSRTHAARRPHAAGPLQAHRSKRSRTGSVAGSRTAGSDRTAVSKLPPKATGGELKLHAHATAGPRRTTTALARAVETSAGRIGSAACGHDTTPVTLNVPLTRAAAVTSRRPAGAALVHMICAPKARRSSPRR
jgi:hypothetical protein